jgi:hypothetical protein
VRDKHKLTENLLAQLSNSDLNVATAYGAWWHNIRPRGGMRLTPIGYDILRHKIKVQCYEYALDPLKINSRTLISLDRKLQEPYYIKTVKMMPVKLVFFGSKEAMLANLYGDIDKFLDNY